MDTQNTISNSTFTWTMLAIYIPFIAFMVWVPFGKRIRRWWRRRKLSIPNEENGVKTISGPTWEVTWVKVSEAPEKRPDEVRTTVLGHSLPEVMQVLKARYGDEFDEQNVRSADKRSYTNVLVGIPGSEK
jgi:hypothetical protein